MLKENCAKEKLRKTAEYMTASFST